MLTLMAASEQALAQAASQDSGGEDIVVTARRVEERLQDVPISITVFNQAQLSARNIVSAGDISLYTPSLTTNSRFGPEKTSFTLRGFNQDVGTAPTVGIYFADAPSLRALSSTASGNGAGPGAFFDLQNLQVLKGPQGTLFGRNTSGGAVLLVPQKPTAQFEGYIEGSLGNHDMRRVQAVLNAPLSDTLRIRLGVDRQTREGFMTNYSGIGPRHFNDVDYWAGRASIVWDVTPDLENYTVGTYSKSDSNGFLPRLVACNRGAAAARPATANSALIGLQCNQLDRQSARGGFYKGESAIIDPYQRVEQWQVINTTTWKASDALTVKNIFSYGEFREHTRGTVYGENLLITSGPQAGRNAFRVLSQPYPGRPLASGSTLTEELQFQGNGLGYRLTWQAGGYLERNDPLGYAGVVASTSASCTTVDAFNGCTTFQPAAGVGNVATGSSARSNKYSLQDYALYAQATYKLTDQLSVTGGIRYTWDRYQADTRQLSLVPFPATVNPPTGYCIDAFRFGVRGTATNPGTLTEANCQSHIAGKSDAPTWLIDLDYKPTEDILLYVKYARGYRQGGIKTEGYGREAFAPEKIDDYELGIKTSWRGPVRGTLNINGFYNDFTDQQVSAAGALRIPGATPSQVIVNAGKSRIKGVEVDASVTPFEGFTIDAGYSYLDTKVRALVQPPADVVFSSFTPAGARVGYPLLYSPKNKFTVTGTYTLPLPEEVGKVSAGVTVSYNGSQYASYQDTALFLAGAIPSDYGKLPAYTIVNLNMGWTSVAQLPLDLSFFVTNLTKKKYYLATFGGYPSFGVEAGAPGEPRMFGARLRYRFGT